MALSYSLFCFWPFSDVVTASFIITVYDFCLFCCLLHQFYCPFQRSAFVSIYFPLVFFRFISLVPAFFLMSLFFLICVWICSFCSIFLSKMLGLCPFSFSRINTSIQCYVWPWRYCFNAHTAHFNIFSFYFIQLKVISNMSSGFSFDSWVV